ncbi:hypothetical protein ACOMHN_027840 [Nucella lapillus]
MRAATTVTGKGGWGHPEPTNLKLDTRYPDFNPCTSSSLRDPRPRPKKRRGEHDEGGKSQIRQTAPRSVVSSPRLRPISGCDFSIKPIRSGLRYGWGRTGKVDGVRTG